MKTEAVSEKRLQFFVGFRNRTMAIHSTAIVQDPSKIHPSVEIGPNCIIHSDVEIGEGCVFDSSVVVFSGSRIGKNNHFCHGAIIGGLPQDLAFKPETKTGLEIGDNNVFREYVSLHRASKEGTNTIIGNKNYFMTNVHAGHDCIIGDNNIFVQACIMAGFVTIGNNAFVSGLVAIHQFCRVGDYAMVAGLAKIVQDVPHFVTADGNPSTLIGTNVIGLKRAGFSPDVRSAIKSAYKTIFHSKLKTRDALAQLESSNPIPEVQKIIDFFRSSDRGVTDHR